MLHRRQFVGLIPVAALSVPASAQLVQQGDRATSATEGLIASPPVVQHPSSDGFTVHFAVSALATGWVEWGSAPDRLDQKAIPQQHGLVQAHDRALAVRVEFADRGNTGDTIFYRVVAQPLEYENAYELRRGDPQASPLFSLRLPRADASELTVAIINDTHEQRQTLDALHGRIETLKPDVLVWNGDTCNDFDIHDNPQQIVLNPGGDVSRGWAAERPLLFVPGNHDVRGARARELTLGLSGWPEQDELPYNFALRIGPLALVGLDTGEDKPDAHPVFAGTAAYEPYREKQSRWLRRVLERPDIAAAPFRIAVCHIPLRGRPGDNDGTTLEGFAAYSGFGAQLWLPQLRRAHFQAVISGHTHRDRVDDASPEEPVMQVVGGGPQPNRATLTVLHASENTLELRVENLPGERLHERTFSS